MDAANRSRATRDFGDPLRWITAARLRTRRGELGMTQQDLVDALREMGVGPRSVNAYSRLENGQEIKVPEMVACAEALGVTVTWLLGFTDDPASWVPDDASEDEQDRAADRIRPTRALRNANGQTRGQAPILGIAR